MKKILLVAVIALVTLSASAMDRTHVKKSVTKEMRANFANGMKAKFTALNDIESIQAKLKTIKAQPTANKVTHRADEVYDQLVPAYSIESAFYDSQILGGFTDRYFYSGASFLIDGEKAYLAPFEDLGYVEGTLDATAENLLESYGAVVYKFTSSKIGKVTYTDGSMPDVELVLEPAYQGDDYLAHRTGETTFNAYYFAETNELFIPEILAAFDANSTNTEVVEDLVIVDLDLLTQDYLNQFISKGTFTGASFFTTDDENNDVAGDCEIFVGFADEGLYYVKGANDDALADSWVAFEIDETDPTIATVDYFQYLGLLQFYTDATRTEVEPGIVVTYGVDLSTGRYTQYSRYQITDNADNTTTIASTDNTRFENMILFEGEGEDSMGCFNRLDLSITILWDPAYPDAGGDDTAIKGVKSEKVNANGTYNLNGQRVNDNAKGLIIKDGKKVIMK